jgi:predicted transcriptional regulator
LVHELHALQGISLPEDEIAHEGPEARSATPSQRELVHQLIRAKPGISIGELLARLPIGGGTLYHHLSKLQRSGDIYLCVFGRRRLAYPAGERVPAENVAAASILRGRSARRIATAIVCEPNRSVDDISIEVGETRRVVYYHLQRLAKAGLVTRSRSGQLEISPRPALVAAVGALPPGMDVDEPSTPLAS